MLKNKFGMTKILVLVLSVLMLVSLVACNKADGPSTDDMNAAIQAAIDAANAEQAAKEAALAASIAADKAAQEAKDAALAESIAKEKAENDAALKKAQEEAKAAADAAAKASEAAKAAADKAAKEAADAAAKAASEAAKKAQEAADKQASELAAALEAAKAEALKAQEEASKAAEEASKAIAEASKAAEEAAKASSQLAETTVPAETTVVVPAETTVVTPAVPVDKTEVLAAFSKLKTEYTYTKQAMYNADEYAELVLLFDKASLDLNNAASVEAATAVLETLKVDAAAVRSVENAALEVAALVKALGDIETEVFTTQIEKITEAKKAYAELKKEYKNYFANQVALAAAEDKVITNDDVATKLGIDVEDLTMADAKTAVLADYLKVQLYAKMKTLYNEVDGKLTRFDAEATYNKADKTLYNTIKSAYYEYLVLAVVNGGDFGDGLAVDWEFKLDADGKVVKTTDANQDHPLEGKYANGAKVYDLEKPIEWFTTDELLEYFILPTLDVEFDAYTTTLANTFKAGLPTLDGLKVKNGETEIVPGIAADLDLSDIEDALVAELEALSFVDDFKGNATMDDAKAAANTIAIKAYIEAMNEYLAVAKTLAIENKKIATEDAIEDAQAVIDGYKDQQADSESASYIERLNVKIEKKNAEIETLKANEASYIANVQAAALLTYEEMLNEELAESDEYETVWVDITNFKKVYNKDDATKLDYDPNAKIAAFLQAVLANTIKANFVDELEVEIENKDEEELFDLIDAVVTDLEKLRLQVSPYEDDETDATIFNAKAGDKYIFRGSAVSYVDDPYYFTNTEKFVAIVNMIDAAIAEIEATTTEGITPSTEKVTDKDGNVYYFQDESAYNYAIENELTLDEVMASTKKLVAVKISNTTYPVTYTYTAAEQAAKTVAEKYVAVCTNVNKELVALNGDVSEAKKQITNSGATAYDKILSTVSGVLKTEVENVANTYLGQIDTAVTTFANNSSLAVKDLFTKTNKWNEAKNSADFVQIKKAGADFTKDYDFDGYETKVEEIVETFEKNFFMTKTKVEEDTNTTFVELETEIDYTRSKVVELWNAKLAAVEYITAEMAKYKNAFVPEYANNAGVNTATGLFTLKANLIGRFNYDGVAGNAYRVTTEDNEATTDIDETVITPDNGSVKANVVAKSAEAIAYEAELDALLAKYIELIMGVEIGDGKTTITNGAGAKISGFAGDDASKINYSLTKATAALEAYKTALFGTQTYIATANNASVKTVYEYADSEIFKAYNTIILKNTYGVTRPQVAITLGNMTNGTVKVSNPYIGSKFELEVKPADGYILKPGTLTVSGSTTTITTNDAGTKYYVTVDYAGSNDITEAITINAEFVKSVALVDKTAEVVVGKNDKGEDIKKDPTKSVSATLWAGQVNPVFSFVLNNTANGTNQGGVNHNGNFTLTYKDTAGNTKNLGIVAAYNKADGTFTWNGTIPTDAVEVYVVVGINTELRPEVKAEADDNSAIIADTTKVGGNAHAQVAPGAVVTFDVAVRSGYALTAVKAAVGETALATGATFTCTDTTKNIWTVSYTVADVTTAGKLITLTCETAVAPTPVVE